MKRQAGQSVPRGSGVGCRNPARSKENFRELSKGGWASSEGAANEGPMEQHGKI